MDISELKLRAWDKSESKMFDVAMVDIFGGFVIDGEEFKERRYVELMRHTGLKDRNDNEIFEGDVLRDERGKIYTVKWGVSSTGSIAITNETHSNAYSLYHLAPKTEVIGNTYERPHLLAKEEK